MKKIFTCIFFVFIGFSSFSQERQDIQYSTSADFPELTEAVIVDDLALVHTAQVLPLDKMGRIAGSGEINSQINQVFLNVSAILKNAGSDLKKIVKLHFYLKDSNLIDVVQEQIAKRFQSGKRPAISLVVGELSHAEALISMDAIAVSANKSARVDYMMAENHSANKTTAQAAILPAGPVVYVSGQAVKGALAEATRGTLEQLHTTLLSIGLEKKDIVQIKSFIRPMSDLKLVEKEFSDFFKGSTIPPMVNVEWTSKDPVIEIELIASSPNTRSSSDQQIDFITPPGMTASPIYCKVTRINYGQKIYTSGLYGKTSGSADSELTSLFTWMGTILKNTGSDFRHLVKATYYVGSDIHSAKLNEVRPKYYDPLRPPAASKAMVKHVGKSDAGVSIDMIGVVIK